MSESQNSLPFEALGQRLRRLRQKLNESPADVSGAVEIEEKTLGEYESGRERPSKDILSLLISHFDIQDEDALQLWKLAGYEPPRPDNRDDDIEEPAGRSNVLVVAIDPRVIYTDGVQVNATKNGVVLHFAQMAGSPQQIVTSRIGMSREQARSVISTLQAALDRTEPRQLQAGTTIEEPQEEPKDSSKKAE
ncbi:MAG TPA: helix-turn-helix transcriptional regulator [Candidatus Saccharimonadales bacterium]|nr:helix-turn-helix transcriptional regulator [Candidatus Saccharimonadales bacterium]